MRLTWATDIHLDFITSPENIEASINNIDTFCSLFRKEQPEAILLTGDISLSNYLQDHLLALEDRLQVPIYFILGNHDFWGNSIESTRRKIVALSNSSEFLRYLSAIPYVMLNDTTALIGHDGWYDGLYDNPRNSDFIMNDWSLIGEFVNSKVVSNRNTINLETLLMIARREASTSAHHVANGIKSVISQKSPNKIIVATHVPPFTQPLNYVKSVEKKDLYPWYSSKIMGDMLINAANANKHIQFEVFCGHCHVKSEEEILQNLRLRSGIAEYANPHPQGTFNI